MGLSRRGAERRDALPVVCCTPTYGSGESCAPVRFPRADSPLSARARPEGLALPTLPGSEGLQTALAPRAPYQGAGTNGVELWNLGTRASDSRASGQSAFGGYP